MLFSFIVLIICVSVQPGGVPPAPAPALADHKNLRDALRKLSGAGGTPPPTKSPTPSSWMAASYPSSLHVERRTKYPTPANLVGGDFSKAPTATPTNPGIHPDAITHTGAIAGIAGSEYNAGQFTMYPTTTPSKAPTATPSKAPTPTPSKAPTATPSKAPTATPSKAPTATPSKAPTATPSKAPTATPSKAPTAGPTP